MQRRLSAVRYEGLFHQFARLKLPLDDVKRMLDSGAEKGIQVVSFTGGEPFLFRDELIEMIRSTGRAGIRCIRTETTASSCGKGVQRKADPG